MATTNFTGFSFDPQSLSQLIAFTLYSKLNKSGMRRIRKETYDAISKATSLHDSVSLTLGDLFTLAHNCRAILREADRLLAQGKKDDELEQSHSFVAKDSGKLTRLIVFAAIERVGGKLFGLDEQYYSTAAARLYWQQTLAMDEMAEVAEVPWFENCEALA